MRRFPLDGEPLVLDLLNTRVLEGGTPHELLNGTGDLRAWVTRHPAELPEPHAPACVPEVVRLREAAREVLVAVRQGSQPPSGALATINGFAAARPATAFLDVTSGRVQKKVVRQGSPEEQLVAALADAVITFLSSPAAPTVRDCAAPGCVLLFLPSHPARRWCSSRTCGNRVRVARHYMQRKGQAE